MFGMKDDYTAVEVIDLYRVLVTETKKFFDEAGFAKAVIGISGGIDSALVAAIARDALGSENVIGVSMPSSVSSKGSIVDAEKLAENLGIKLHMVPLHSSYTSITNDLGLVEDYLEKTEKDLSVGNCITEENIQARLRMVILMAFANRMKALLLNTCNLTEDLVGYSTMYGDSAGALAPLGNIGKMMVYNLARSRNEASDDDGNPIPNEILNKKPSAELFDGQTDEDALGMEYKILDPLTRALKKDDFVKHYLTLKEIAKMEDIEFSEVQRIFQLIKFNAFKLKQAPPAIDVSKVYE